MTQKYVIYRRVSSDEQGKSGLGLDGQSRDIDIFLANYAGDEPEVIGEFVEVHSAFDNNRPQLTLAVDLSRKSGATLIVAKLDRLSRRVSFISRLMEDKKLSFRVAQMPHADKFQLHIYAALAEQEREFISARTRVALDGIRTKIKEDGFYVTKGGKKINNLGGHRPGINVRNEARAKQALDKAGQIRAIVFPMRDGGSTLQQIASALDDAGVKTLKGCKWTPASVSRVIDRLKEADARSSTNLFYEHFLGVAQSG